MKRISLVLCCALISASAFSFDANSDFKKFVTKALKRVDKAFHDRDVKFFDSISTSDFTETMGGKTSTREESMADMKTGFAMAQAITSKSKLVSSKVQGNTATAVASEHAVMVMKPQKKGGKPSRMVMDMVGTQTWVKDGKGWKIKAINWKSTKATLDGKPFDPSKMGGG